MTKTSQKFSITKRIQSFGYAFNGLRILFREEHNSRIRLAVMIGVVSLSAFMDLATWEWVALVFAIGFVFVCEIFNSAIENMIDFISTEKHLIIMKIKDLSACAVLLSALTAVVIGLIIFVPKLLKLYYNS